jgi:hypothetical protein
MKRSLAVISGYFSLFIVGRVAAIVVQWIRSGKGREGAVRAEHSIRGRSQLAARHARELGSTSVVATISPRLAFYFLSVVAVHSSAFWFPSSGGNDGQPVERTMAFWLRSADIK